MKYMQYLTRLITDLQRKVMDLLYRVGQLELIIAARTRSSPQSPQVILSTPVPPRKTMFISDHELNNIYER